MQPTPYLFFNGNCAEAVAFYVDVFGGEIVLSMPASGMPPEIAVPDDRKNWIMHCTAIVGGGKLMASDSIMEPATPMAGASVMMSMDSRDEAETAYNRLAEGGEISMPFAPTFWSTGFGTLTDRFGTKWMVGGDEAP